jgi:hypothetical protein
MIVQLFCHGLGLGLGCENVWVVVYSRKKPHDRNTRTRWRLSDCFWHRELFGTVRPYEEVLDNRRILGSSRLQKRGATFMIITVHNGCQNGKPNGFDNLWLQCFNDSNLHLGQFTRWGSLVGSRPSLCELLPLAKSTQFPTTPPPPLCIATLLLNQ